MQDKDSLDSSSLKACQSKSLIGCFSMLCFCSKKGWNLKHIHCFKSSWLLFIVSCIPIKTWMWKIQDTNYQVFFQMWKVWNFRRGKLYNLLMVNVSKRDAKIKWWTMPTCYCLTFSHVFPTFSVFKVVYHEHTFAFLLLFQFCRSLSIISFVTVS